MHPSPELLALLALGEAGAADPAERAHIESCPECFAEVAELAHLARVGRTVNGSGELLSPAPHVWERIQAEIAEIAAQETVAPDASRGAEPISPISAPEPVVLPFEPPVRTTASSNRRRRGVLITAVAAVVALVAGVAIGFGVGNRAPDRGTVGNDTVARGQLTALPDWTGSTGTARLERDAAGRRMLVVSIDASKPLSGNQAVWLIDPDRPSQMRMLGYLDPTSGQWPVPDSIDVATFSLVDVSEEPADDPSTAHSGNSIVRGPLT